jgi:hypothetical protein
MKQARGKNKVEIHEMRKGGINGQGLRAELIIVN